jgi:hypothetical protein
MELRARIASSFLAAAFAVAPLAASALTYSESVNGDLAGTRLTPTSLSLDVGSNLISGSVVMGDVDYVTLNIPAGASLAQLTLSDYSTSDNLAFIAIQAGSQFTEPAIGTNVANLLGYSHIDFSQPPGADYLVLMNSDVNGLGAIGYTTPLPSGAYTLWIQQTGPELTGYTWNAVVTAPEPGALALLALGLAGVLAARARRVS